mgnify:CR=1 FL=1
MMITMIKAPIIQYPCCEYKTLTDERNSLFSIFIRLWSMTSIFCFISHKSSTSWAIRVNLIYKDLTKLQISLAKTVSPSVTQLMANLISSPVRSPIYGSQNIMQKTYRFTKPTFKQLFSYSNIWDFWKNQLFSY